MISRMRSFLAGLALALAVPALAAVTYNYFAPGGALSCAAPCTAQSVNVGSGSFVTGTLPEANTVLGSAITPTALAANTNNYNPTGAAGADIWNISSSTAVDLTGAVGATLNRTLTLRNVGANAITLRDQSASSTAANRFILSITNNDGATNDLILPAGAQFALRGAGTGWVPYTLNDYGAYDTTNNDVLLGKFTGPNFLVWEGTAINNADPAQTQTLVIGNADITNTSVCKCTATNQVFNTSADSSASAANVAATGAGNIQLRAYSVAGGNRTELIANLATQWGTGAGSIAHSVAMDLAGNFALKAQSSATADTNGYVYMPSVSGAPTGVPAVLTGLYAGASPFSYDTTNNRLSIYNGAWRAVPLIPFTAPTVSSGFGTSPSVTQNNGPSSFSVNVGTGGTASTGVVGLPAAPHAWACAPSDTGATPTGRTEVTGPSSTTTVTVTNFSRTTGLALAWTASEVIQLSCWPN